MKRAIKMHDSDQVATVLDDIKRYEQVEIYDKENVFLRKITSAEDIPYGNKIALQDIKEGEVLIKYGVPVGICTKNISAGFLVHVHNVKSQTVDIPPAIRAEIMKQMHID